MKIKVLVFFCFRDKSQTGCHLELGWVAFSEGQQDLGDKIDCPINAGCRMRAGQKKTEKKKLIIKAIIKLTIEKENSEIHTKIQ